MSVLGSLGLGLLGCFLGWLCLLLGLCLSLCNLICQRVVVQTEDISDKSDWVMDVGGGRLLDWDAILIQNVRLINVEDL